VQTRKEQKGHDFDGPTTQRHVEHLVFFHFRFFVAVFWRRRSRDINLRSLLRLCSASLNPLLTTADSSFQSPLHGLSKIGAVDARPWRLGVSKLSQHFRQRAELLRPMFDSTM
jgi:hypothetical protein